MKQELCHYHRKDHWALWISTIASVVFGFHPLVIKLCSIHKQMIELACDQRLIINGIDTRLKKKVDFHHPQWFVSNISLCKRVCELWVREGCDFKKHFRFNERYCVPPEISCFLKSLGFKKVDIFGAKLGAFSRTDTLTLDDFEMLVIAEK